MDVYIGIDVACAKDKYLPLVMCYWESERLIPLPLASSPIKPPKCSGLESEGETERKAEFKRKFM